jgi:hypothetical protein
MPVMPGDDHPTAEPSADPREERAAAQPHANIVARLLEYQRRLREETGGEPARFGAGPEPPPSAEVQPAPAETTQASGEVAEPEEPPRPEPALGVSGDEGSEPPDARTLNERIERLDETPARISAMLPLLRGQTKRGSRPDATASGALTLWDRGGSSVGQSSGLIIRRSQVQVLPAPRRRPSSFFESGPVG